MQAKLADNMAYVFCSDYGEKVACKRAGFKCVNSRGIWATSRMSVAAKVASLLTPAEKQLLRPRYLRELANEKTSSAITTNFRAPTDCEFDFWPYQHAGIEHMAGLDNVYLADPMGVGKTPQAIGLANIDKDVKSVLIVGPAIAKLHWLREWQRWSIKGLSCGVAYGAQPFPDAQVVIINYDILTRFTREIHARKWDMLIADECHYLKNDETLRSRAVCGHFTANTWTTPPIKARRKVMLSGTPLINSPMDLWGILRYLDPYGWRNREAFAKRYCGARKTPWGWDYSGAQNLDELRTELRRTIMLRRSKKLVLPDMPPKVRQVINIDPDTGLRKAIAKEQKFWQKAASTLGISGRPDTLNHTEYKRVVNAMEDCRNRIEFTELALVRKETALAKLPYVIDHLNDAVDSSGKVVCFAYHKDVIAAIAEEFEGRVVTITGDTTGVNRQLAEDRFQTDNKVQLLVGNTTAAGVVITLTAASHVVFAELDWSPDKIEQAEDRCHRFGQEYSVLCQHLVIAGSLDARMAKKIVTKMDIADRTLDYDESLAFLN